MLCGDVCDCLDEDDTGPLAGCFIALNTTAAAKITVTLVRIELGSRFIVEHIGRELWYRKIWVRLRGGGYFAAMATCESFD